MVGPLWRGLLADFKHRCRWLRAPPATQVAAHVQTPVRARRP